MGIQVYSDAPWRFPTEVIGREIIGEQDLTQV
jgi:hypothetical protein